MMKTLKENMRRFSTKNLTEEVTPNLANTEMFDITDISFEDFINRMDAMHDAIIMPGPGVLGNVIYVLPNASKGLKKVWAIKSSSTRAGVKGVADRLGTKQAGGSMKGM